MILLFHILIAITSVLFTGYSYIQPSESRLKASYGLIGLTLGSGTYLVWMMPTHLVQACISGIAYTVIVLAGIALTRRKLAVAKIQ